MQNTISNSDDRISVSDMTDRIEELEDEIETTDDETELADLVAEQEMLKALLVDCEGGGDHEWRDEWYYGELIRDSNFESYAQQLADDIGAIPAHNSWPCNHIDWKSAAEALLQDYKSIDFDGVTYWARG